MFNKDFYPTPSEVIEQMTDGLNLQDKFVLEPSAGKGDIVKHVLQRGAREVLACEIVPELRDILMQQCTVIEADFLNLTSDRISHVDYIIMNPPFSADEKHILHAFEIAPAGCEIIALCNVETINKQSSVYRHRLKNVIEENGHYLNLGDCFTHAERKTGVEVAMVKLFKPKAESEDEFDGYFDLDERYEEQGDPGLMSYNSIRDVVNRYVGAVKLFDQVMEANQHINDLIKPINSGKGSTIEFGAKISNSHVYTVTREAFKKELQKSAWHKVFSKLKMDKYVTKAVMDKINAFVEKQENVPFTLNNIYKMMEIIIGTHGDRMKTVLIEVFDWLTSHHHENRHHLPGWKTNSMYFVDKKFIAPHCGVSMGYSGQPEINYHYMGDNKMDDFTKALCFLTGQNYDDYTTLSDSFRGQEIANPLHKEACEALAAYAGITYQTAKYIHHYSGSRLKYELSGKVDDAILDKAEQFYKTHNYGYESRKDKEMVYKDWGQWLDWGFFEIKVYKKGTLHARFKDDTVWELFNKACAKAKGWRLPTNTGSDVRRKSSGVEVY